MIPPTGRRRTRKYHKFMNASPIHPEYKDATLNNCEFRRHMPSAAHSRDWEDFICGGEIPVSYYTGLTA